jgi:hypothetical protein
MVHVRMLVSFVIKFSNLNTEDCAYQMPDFQLRDKLKTKYTSILHVTVIVTVVHFR